MRKVGYSGVPNNHVDRLICGKPFSHRRQTYLEWFSVSKCVGWDKKESLPQYLSLSTFQPMKIRRDFPFIVSKPPMPIYGICLQLATTEFYFFERGHRSANEIVGLICSEKLGSTGGRRSSFVQDQDALRQDGWLVNKDTSTGWLFGWKSIKFSNFGCNSSKRTPSMPKKGNPRIGNHLKRIRVLSKKSRLNAATVSKWWRKQCCKSQQWFIPVNF